MSGWLLLIGLLIPAIAVGQQPLEELPGYDQFRSLSGAQRTMVQGGRIGDPQWADDGSAFFFSKSDQHYRVELPSGEMESIDADERPAREGRAGNGTGRRFPGRALQRTQEPSPDGKWTAVYENFNIVLKPAEGEEVRPVTTTGSERFRYGTACWVYGEELDQNEAMWWSPDSAKLAFYEIDERHMADYYLTLGNTEQYTEIHSERYPKAGDPNPYVGLLVYDLATEEQIRVDVGGARSWYTFDIRFTPDGSALLFHRTNRHQDLLQVVAANVETGQSRVVVEEKQSTWQKNSPTMQFLADGKRFIWETERNGFRHYELRHLDGRLLNTLSQVDDYPASSIVRVDESAGYFYYAANSGEHPLNEHLHRARLDGSDASRLTRLPLHHSSFDISPDHKHFVCRYESLNDAPVTALYDMEGNRLAQLDEADTSQLREAGLEPPEMFKFTADDGQTDLYGVLYKPSNFDPNREYPLVISVYGGPSSRAIYNRFSVGNPYCEFGFLIARIDNRGTVGRGKAFESANYLDLGGVDLKDQIDGIRYLAERPYVDQERVGIYGHSYGGYMSALAILKYPDDIHVAVAGAPVTDWRNYDTIYTERYMRTPQENAEGYAQGSCLTYADNLKGKLLLLHGLIDDNVHPSNSWQLIDKLQSSDKRFDLMVYPRSKHGLIGSASLLRWEFLHQHLKPEVGGSAAQPDRRTGS